MKLITRYIIAGLLATTGMSLPACKKMVEVGLPRNQVVTDAAFADSINATAAIMGIYTRIINSVNFSFGNGGATRMAGLVTDELLTNRNNPSETELAINGISIDNSLNAEFWRDGYRILYQINACLEGIAGSPGISASAKKTLTSEAHFTRAYIYFYLVNFYGDVPLILSTDYKTNAIEPRSSVSVVMSKIIEDLEEAINYLPTSYPQGSKVRANKNAAVALLARVQLFAQNWQKATELSTEIISSGLYQLPTDPSKVFLSNSPEAIWHLPSLVQGFETAEGYNFVPTSSSSLPGYEVSQLLLNSFSADDLRLINWFSKNLVNGVDRWFPFKYKLGYTGLTEPKEYYTLLRLGEQYLIRAEARLHDQDLDGAIADLNTIRHRAGLPDFNSTNTEEIQGEIELQRKLELCLELGHRFFDLKRTNRIDEVLGVLKAPGWQPTDKLFPIPAVELTLNYQLNQNPGY